MSKRHTYTVQQLARLAGVSVRTLHHYDHIGLLKPSARTTEGVWLISYKKGLWSHVNTE